ncbi:hypothetical protein IFM89_036121 [Coptis chinensis]|uniref:Uncharacterized protein n=1 Tax=Coptis chinensis TaxID=261450 RepID=A0A835HPQ4_9MAGN|nr:hypothetical protein IFM89_036121 [Coptis chinensis]
MTQGSQMATRSKANHPNPKCTNEDPLLESGKLKLMSILKTTTDTLDDLEAKRILRTLLSLEFSSDHVALLAEFQPNTFPYIRPQQLPDSWSIGCTWNQWYYLQSPVVVIGNCSDSVKMAVAMEW